MLIIGQFNDVRFYPTLLDCLIHFIRLPYTLSGMDENFMPDFLYKKRTFGVPTLYNQFTTKIMKEG